MIALIFTLTVGLCPVDGPQTVWDNYGWARPNGRAHGGIDIDAPAHTPLVAVVSGRVVEVKWDWGGGGNTVILQSGDTAYFYAHLDAPSPRIVGEWVRKGDIIGYVGRTGNARNDHLHFSVYPRGRPGWTVDPYPLVSCNRQWERKHRAGAY